MPYHEQITQHFCIQGWSGVAKWGGVSMQTIVDLVKPRARSQMGGLLLVRRRSGWRPYYDAHPIEQMTYHLTMLAYDMNGEPSRYGHGAPLRLRNEVQLGFKQVKWIKGSSSSPTSPRSAAATAATTRTTNSSATAKASEPKPR